MPTISTRYRLALLACLIGGAMSCPLQARAHAQETTPQAEAAPAAPASSPWWRSLADPHLPRLIDKALVEDADLACAVERLRTWDEEERRNRRRLGPSIERLFGKDDGDTLSTAREIRAGRIAGRRTRLVERVALAYLEVRNLQRRISQREELAEQYRDNAEIAEFRRQAGLVPATDGAVARSQDKSARVDLDDDRQRLADALDTLATLVGEDSATLAAQLGSTSPFPPWVPASQTAPTTDGGLTRELDMAKRTVRDARIAYRAGAGSMATLYVAEAAAISLQQSLVDQQTRALAQDVRERMAADQDWAKAGLEPLPAPAPRKAKAATPDAKTPLIVTASRCD